MRNMDLQGMVDGSRFQSDRVTACIIIAIWPHHVFHIHIFAPARSAPADSVSLQGGPRLPIVLPDCIHPTKMPPLGVKDLTMPAGERLLYLFRGRR